MACIIGWGKIHVELCHCSCFVGIKKLISIIESAQQVIRTVILPSNLLIDYPISHYHGRVVTSQKHLLEYFN